MKPLVSVSGVFETMADRRAFQVYLANAQVWAPADPDLGRRIGWTSAGRLAWYMDRDPIAVAGFRRALLQFKADPETVKLSVWAEENANA